MHELEAIGEKILADLEAKNAVRDRAVARSRQLVRHCANSIRAVHRGEFDRAATLLSQAAELVSETAREAKDYPDIYFAGYVQDGLKEFAEAHVLYALINGQPLPHPDALGVEYAAYLNGLGEAVGELRRHVLDLIRHGQVEQGERFLEAMEDIYGLLVTVDYPDAVTRGLRRTTDMVRGVLERTRGDLTMAMRQEILQRELRTFEEVVRQLGRDDNPR